MPPAFRPAAEIDLLTCERATTLARMILDRPEQLAAFRARATVTIQDVLDERCAPAILDALDSIVTAGVEDGGAYFGYVWPPRIATRLPYPGDPWMAIRGYCARRLPSLDLLAWTHLFEALIAAFQPEDVGAWIAPGVLRRLEPSLPFDDDGLLLDDGTATFTSQGVLTRRHWVLYDQRVPGRLVSGGFVEDVVAVAGEGREYFGLRTQPDAVLGREHAQPVFARAFIRGPRGISEAMLNDPRFPEDKRGTVTEHRRTSDDPVLALFPFERFEVMWSERHDVNKGEHFKTVQMEELRPASKRGEIVANRYIHSQWDCNSGVFTHLDGAVRGHAPDQYDVRLATDIKKAGKSARVYEKLFRIDAPLDVKTWSTLVAKFFDNNELAIEYLGGEDARENA